MINWQSMDTAPKNRVILGRERGVIAQIRWDEWGGVWGWHLDELCWGDESTEFRPDAWAEQD